MLKKINYLMAFLGIITIFLAGCSNEIKNQEQYIKVQKRMGDQNKYEDFKEITNQMQVQMAKNILDEIDWVNAKVDMTRPPDVRFTFQFSNPKIVQEKNDLYELWISPNKDRVELVIDAESKYVQLDKDKSEALYKVLTGELLSE